MSYREVLGNHVIAISISDSADMAALGQSEQHLRDAMAEIARHLLALGARLAYGGDLRPRGFSELLFELVARHRRDADEGDERTSVTNYLAWPVHIGMAADYLDAYEADLAGSASLALLNLDGTPISLASRHGLPEQKPTIEQWSDGLSSMRSTMLLQTDARVVMGGKVDGYMGVMPGVAEEALLSLRDQQPLFVLGGFGGCARDIAEKMGLASNSNASRSGWAGIEHFGSFPQGSLNNGLSAAENALLASTPHVDQAVALVLHGLLNLPAGR